MKIKIQESDMLASARKIDSQIDKLERMQRELQNMLNSTNWDMRARRPMESQLSDARKLNKELTTITKNMSDMVKKTTDSMKQRDIELGNSINNTSESIDEAMSYKPSEDNKTKVEFFDIDPDFSFRGFGTESDSDSIINSPKFKGPGISMGLEGDIFSYEDEIDFGNSTIGAGVGVDIGLGNVVAKGEASADITSGDLYAKGQIGAYVGKAEANGSIKLGPFEIEGSIGSSFGIGIGGDIGIEDGKIGIGGNVAVGPGVGFDVSLGFNEDWFKEFF